MSIFGFHTWDENAQYLKALLVGYRSLNNDIIAAKDKIPEKQLNGWRTVRNNFADWLKDKNLKTLPFIVDFSLRETADIYAGFLRDFRGMYIHNTGNTPTLSDEEIPKPSPPSDYGWVLPVALGVGGLIVLKEVKGLLKD